MNTGNTQARVKSVAMRIHHMDDMLAFYSEAFGIEFHEVATGPFQSQFGDLDGMTLKFVPIRDGVDFEGYPVHQLGVSVADVERVISLAIQHGGRQEGEIVITENGTSAAVRDPDGNTIELYSEKD